MPHIHVCSLARVPETVRTTGARTLVTLINLGTPVPRPDVIEEGRHLFVAMSDISVATDGHILPADAHVDTFLAFIRLWDRQAPMVVHCYAGVSRSTAAAYIAACALDPSRSEAEIARELRDKSPTATPNSRLIAVADAVLGREGRMVAAVAAIGRGAECYEGVPFALTVPA